jgi:hypothetical protein
MRVIRKLDELHSYLKSSGGDPGLLVDTGFLYGLGLITSDFVDKEVADERQDTNRRTEIHFDDSVAKGLIPK